MSAIEIHIIEFARIILRAKSRKPHRKIMVSKSKSKPMSRTPEFSVSRFRFDQGF